MRTPNQSHPDDLSLQEIRRILSVFSLDPSQEQAVKIAQYVQLLLQWNRSVSLTSVTNSAEILSRHFGESIFAASVAAIEKGRLADVGSGAGFPGLAIKIMRPDLDVVLIEPNKKKAAFLWEVVRGLKLSPVEILTSRFEESIFVDADKFDFITARALGALPDLLDWSKKSLAEQGQVVLWLGMEDLTRISKLNDWVWTPGVRIPDSQRRFLLSGHPAARV